MPVDYNKDVLPVWIRASSHIHPYVKESETLVNARKFKNYLQSIEHLFKSMNITDPEHKKKLLCYTGGYDIEKVGDLYPDATDDTDDVYKKLVKKLSKFHNVDDLETTARLEFHRYTQKADQTFNQFHFKVNELYEDTGYGATPSKNDLIRDRLVAGARMDRIRTRVLEQKNLDLASVVDYANATASASATTKAMSNGSQGVKVSKVTSSSSVQCTNCGSKFHSRGSPNCKAKDKVCHSCQKLGHFSSQCRSKGSNSKKSSNFAKNNNQKKSYYKSRKVEAEDENSSQMDETDQNVLSSLVSRIRM